MKIKIHKKFILNMVYFILCFESIILPMIETQLNTV